MAMVATVACGDDATVEPSPTPANVATIAVTSAAFADGEPVPVQYTCDGDGVSLPLSWEAGPVGTVAYAIVMDDPDAPGGTYVHWVIGNLPANVTSLDEGATGAGIADLGGIEGKNSAGKSGYTGPCPPKGSAPHHYGFTVYAVDTTIQFVKQPTASELVGALAGHLLAEGKLTGTFSR